MTATHHQITMSAPDQQTPDAGALPPMKLSALPETLMALAKRAAEEIHDSCIICEPDNHKHNDPAVFESFDDAKATDIIERALAAATEEKDQQLAQWKKVAAEGRWAGRQEAVEILLADDAEDPLDECRESSPSGDSGDYGVQWNEEKLRAKFDAKPGEFKSLYDRVDTALMEMCYSDDQSKLTELERENRELREDKARLDWMNDESQDDFDRIDEMQKFLTDSVQIREAIDLAMMHHRTDAARNGGAT